MDDFDEEFCGDLDGVALSAERAKNAHAADDRKQSRKHMADALKCFDRMARKFGYVRADEDDDEADDEEEDERSAPAPAPKRSYPTGIRTRIVE